jgi:hypothetical protein
MIVVVKIRFRRVGFRFDALAAWLLCQQYGVDLDEMDKIPPEEYIFSWLWSAHRSFSMFNRKKDKYNYEGMKRFIGRMPKNEWDRVLEAINSTKAPASKKKASHKRGVTSSSLAGVPEYVRTNS